MSIDFNKLIALIIDQSTWRPIEWGNRLIQGQFEHLQIPFTKDSVQCLINYINTAEGKQTITDIIKSNSCYFDMCDSIEDAVEMYLDDQFGLFGRTNLENEKANAGY